MYNFELTLLEPGSAQLETLRMVENICDEFELQDHFGTISMAIHNIVEYFINTSNGEFEIMMSFLIEPESLSVIIHSNSSFMELKEDIQSSNENNKQDIYSSLLLTDVLEFREDDAELYFKFHVKPHIKAFRINAKMLKSIKANSHVDKFSEL